MPSSPDITVAAVVAEADGRFLVVEERINRKLVFNQPAGHVERGETLVEAVVREVREETAWSFTPNYLIGIYLWKAPSGRSFMRFAFTGTVADHDAAQPLDRGIVAAHWFSISELVQRGPQLRSPLVMRCIEDYLRGERRPLASVAELNLDTAPTVAATTL